MAIRQGQIQQQASVSVMKMAMGDAKQKSEGLQNLMSSMDVTTIQRAVQPHLGGNIDIKV